MHLGKQWLAAAIWLGLVLMMGLLLQAHDEPGKKSAADAAHGAKTGVRHGPLHDKHSPHAQDAAHGHAMLFRQMLPAADADCRAVASGPWSAAATWDGKKFPQADSRVHIPEGITVVVDREFPAPLAWLRIDGDLRLAHDANTSIAADTFVVAPAGRLQIGTADHPVQPDVTAQLIIAPRHGKPIDHAWDPLELARGLVAQGTVETHGAEKTPFVELSVMPRPGSKTIDVDAAPNGWRPGDRLVLTATEYGQDETLRLVAVDGKRITVEEPLQHERTLPVDARGKPHAGLALHLANLTRNVQIRSSSSAAGDPKLQGHVMLMHAGGHRLAWTGFYDLGRTTIKPVTDPVLRDGVRDPGLTDAGLRDENVRGRYALHFHRAGAGESLSVVEGCVVTVARDAGLKIGVVNHSSHVGVRRCVSHNIDGSHYFTEEGDETGDFTGNLAIHSVGSGTSHDEQPRDVMQRAIHEDPHWYHRRRLDVGSRGTGFWINGGGVDVIDNVSAGQAHSGFHVWTRTLGFRLNETYTVRFATANLGEQAWARGDDIDIGDVPMRFNGNTAYVLGHGRQRGIAGFIIDYYGMHVRGRYPGVPYTQVYDLLSWNAGGLQTSYAGNLHLKNVRVIGDASDETGMNLRTQGGNSDLVEDVQLVGFSRGMIAPANTLIKGGQYSAGLGLWVQGGQKTVLDIADMKFAEVPHELLRVESGGATYERKQFDIYRQPIFSNQGLRPTVLFAPQPLEIAGHPEHPDGAELYSLEQMPDYVLPDLGIPGLLDGRTTTAEAWEKYRLAPGGAVAPADAAPLAGLRTNGVFGRPARYDAPISYREAADVVRGYRPSAELRPADRRPEAIEVAAVDLEPGWNFVPVEAEDVRRTLLIHAGPLPRAPRVDAGPDETMRAAAAVALRGAADPSAKLTWTRAYGPAEVAFDDPSQARTRARFAKPGTYVLHLTARSSEGGINTDSVMITVEPQR